MLRKSAVAWFKRCNAVLFLDRGSGEDETDDAIDHESFEPSALNDMSITAFGLPGMESNLRLFDCLQWSLGTNSIINFLQSSTMSCFRHNQNARFSTKEYIRCGFLIQFWQIKLMEFNRLREKTLTFSIPRIPNSWLWYSTARLGSTHWITYSIAAVDITEGTKAIDLESAYS